MNTTDTKAMSDKEKALYLSKKGAQLEKEARDREAEMDAETDRWLLEMKRKKKQEAGKLSDKK